MFPSLPHRKPFKFDPLNLGCGENVSKPRSETSIKPFGIKPRSVYKYGLLYATYPIFVYLYGIKPLGLSVGFIPRGFIGSLSLRLRLRLRGNKL